MKSLLLSAVVFFFLAPNLPAENSAEVALRISRQNGGIRVVLESDEETVKAAIIAVTQDAAKVEFPAKFELKKPADLGFDVRHQDRALIIPIKAASDVKSLKLSSPARIVLDLKAEQLPMQAAGHKEQDVQKAQKSAVQSQPQPVADKQSRYKVVAIDPGHGGYDYGMLSEERKEKDVSLLIARDLAAALTKKGFTAILTRKGDQYLALYDRVSAANSRNAELFLSLHASSSKNFTVYTAAAGEGPADAVVRQYLLSLRQGRHLERSRSIARSLEKTLKGAFKTDAYLQALPLPLLGSANAPAVLIEFPLMRSFGADQKLRDRLVSAILEGILDEK